MSTQSMRAPRALPTDTQTRMQGLLDEGDTLFFLRHPGAQCRVRMHFRGERVEGDEPPSRYVRVAREGDRLVRRFTTDAA